MKIIDLVLLALILFGAYLGYKKGLLVEVLSFFALIIAIVSAFKLMHTGVQYFAPKTPEKTQFIPYLSFLIIFIAVFAGIFLLSKFLKKILDYTLIGTFDNWAGAVLGGLKMAFGISLLLWLSHYAKINFPENIVNESIIYPPLVSFAPKVVHYISFIIPFQDIFPLIEKTLQGQ